MKAYELNKTKRLQTEITPLLVTFGIIAASTTLVWIYQAELNEIGNFLLINYDQKGIDLVLFLITAVSCTPLVLPVWGYALVGVGLGYSIFRLAVIMAFGSAVGSLVTYFIGKYFSQNSWVKKKFPNLKEHPWTYGHSKTYVTWILFIGTASPIPCDLLYAVCGVKSFPPVIFFIATVSGRLVRYTYLGLIFKYTVLGF